MTTRPTIVPPAQPLPRVHTLRFRPRYNECDPMGVVHHAAYVPWLEIGRTDLLRAGGMTYAHLEALGVLLAIVSVHVKYKRPARYDDLLELTTTVVGGSRVKIEHAYELRLVEPAITPHNHPDPTLLPGEMPLLVTACTTLACIDRAGRPQALPEWLVVPG